MKKSRGISYAVLFLWAVIPFACAQTQVDMATQTKDVDFTGAVFTKPAKMGTSVPAVCSLGEIFFDSSATAGQNLFGCTAANRWTQLSGGSSTGAHVASQLADFSPSNTASSVQTFGADCTGANSCQIRIGGVIFSMTGPVTASLSGTVTTGTVFWYLSSSQILTVGHNSPATITCSAGCAVSTGVIAFPPDSVPLWETTFTSNVWDPINSGTMDRRAIYSRDVIYPGSGVMSSYNATTGVQSLATDPTAVPRYFADLGAPAITCTPGRDFFTDITNLHLYFCDAANTWKQADTVLPSRTDVQNFPLAGDAPAGASALATYSSKAATTASATGPNSISYAIAGIPLSVNDAVMVSKKAPATWSGTPGTVDISLVASNVDGASGGGNWNLSVYAGCAAANGTFTYGTASAISAAPPSTNSFQTYSASAINLPVSCAANTPMQFWLQRGADTGGTTGVHVFAMSAEVVIRGN